MQELVQYKTSLKEACELECDDDNGVIKYSGFEEALSSLDIQLTKDQLSYLRMKYFVEMANHVLGFDYSKLLNDLKDSKK
jgi:Ca2+-binding EF-hand superfamily protein